MISTTPRSETSGSQSIASHHNKQCPAHSRPRVECTMNYYFAFSVLLAVLYNCDGHPYKTYNTPILSGILSGAQNVGSDVQAALQGLTQGIEINYQGSLDNNRGQYQYGYQKPRPQQPNNGGYNKPNPPAETIIVIVEEESQPQQNNYGQRPQRPQPNYGYGRPQNNNYNKPNYLNKPGYNYGYNSNDYGNNNHQHRPHHHHHNTPEYYNTPNGDYNNNNNGNYNENNNRPNHYGETQPSEKPDQYIPPKEIATEAPKAKPEQRPTTKQPDEDKPFFVPLTGDQYTYGGDKIEINAPKRETNDNNKPAYDDAVDETFPIDVRIKEH